MEVMELRKVISGGQVGVDVAALRAAREWDIETGGAIPEGWRTVEGAKPELGEEFGLEEFGGWGYPPRTRENVRRGDGTLRFATNWYSPGEKLTLKEILKQGKPSLDVGVRPAKAIWKGGQGFVVREYEFSRSPGFVQEWIEDNGFSVLNVAGNADPALEEPVKAFLGLVFWRLKEGSSDG